MFNILLQILEDGRLTDGHGRAVDFRNTLVIMTSNLGTGRGGQAGDGIPEGWRVRNRRWSDCERPLRRRLKRTFRPELLNRIDEIVVFEPLTQEQIIADSRPASGGGAEASGRARHQDRDVGQRQGVAVRRKGSIPCTAPRPCAGRCSDTLRTLSPPRYSRGSIGSGARHSGRCLLRGAHLRTGGSSLTSLRMIVQEPCGRA